ncbi:hypothetical protein DAMA08_015630 [Martiniozyma asiatica (nom. inval.)]|nr:hypothetical protein DAMA08_015630 [Martiniozyma asiatica]
MAYGSIESTHAPLDTPINRRFQTFLIHLHHMSIMIMPIFFFLLAIFPPMWPFLLLYLLMPKGELNGKVWFRRREWLRNLSFWKEIAGYFPISFELMTPLEPTFSNVSTLNSSNSSYTSNSKILKIKEPWETVIYKWLLWIFKFNHHLIKLIFGIISWNKPFPPMPHLNTKYLERTGPNYIFGYHPHGVLATGVSIGFTNNIVFPYPMIKCFVTTLATQFTIPFYRDYLLALGVTSVIKSNLKSLLKMGASIVIVIGGAQESLLARPGGNSLVLNKRKGFIKLALEENCLLVPVYAFGENSVYDVFYTGEEGRDNNSNVNSKINFKRNSSVASNDSDVTLNEELDKNIGEEYSDCELELLANLNSKNKNNLLPRIRQALLYFQHNLKSITGFTLPIIISRGIFNYDFGFLPHRRPVVVLFGKPIKVYRLSKGEITQQEIDYWHQKYINGVWQVWKEGEKRGYVGNLEQKLKIVE